MWTRFLSDYGMLFVLLALCAVLSVVTWGEQYPGGAAGGESLAFDVIAATPPGARALIVVRAPGEDVAVTGALATRLRASGRLVLDIVPAHAPGAPACQR